MVDLIDINDFDEIPTVVIPTLTLREQIYGEGHAPSGPDRPTRDLRPMDESSEDDVPTLDLELTPARS